MHGRINPMKNKIAVALVAALTLGATMVAGASQAQARWHRGWGGGGLRVAPRGARGAARPAAPLGPPVRPVRQLPRHLEVLPLLRSRGLSPFERRERPHPPRAVSIDPPGGSPRRAGRSFCAALWAGFSRLTEPSP